MESGLLLISPVLAGRGVIMEKKKNKGLLKKIYGFLGVVVSVISLAACIAYRGPVYLIASALSLLLISGIILSSGINDSKR